MSTDDDTLRAAFIEPSLAGLLDVMDGRRPGARLPALDAAGQLRVGLRLRPPARPARGRPRDLRADAEAERRRLRRPRPGATLRPVADRSACTLATDAVSVPSGSTSIAHLVARLQRRRRPLAAAPPQLGQAAPAAGRPGREQVAGAGRRSRARRRRSSAGTSSACATAGPGRSSSPLTDDPAVEVEEAVGVVAVLDLVGGDDPRADRGGEVLALRGPEPDLHLARLEVARRPVVDDRVAEDRVPGLGLGRGRRAAAARGRTPTSSSKSSARQRAPAAGSARPGRRARAGW